MNLNKTKRQKHDYTSEIELKSLLIRIKNKKIKLDLTTKNNTKINRYIKTYVKLNKTKYPQGSLELKKKIKLKSKLKNKIVELSEKTIIDYASKERFGEIILLMIKSILTKPNFSGYTYKTDFYSDAIHKILKYLHNFNHKLISKRSGTVVNSFAYISQIIHNSIIFIIKSKKQEIDQINKQISKEILDNNLNIIDHNRINSSDMFYDKCFKKEIIKEIKLKKSDTFDSIKNTIIEFRKDENNKDTILNIYYPDSIKISLHEYDELKPLLKYTNVQRYSND